VTLVLHHLGSFIPRTAPVSSLISTVALVKGPCNRERSVLFYRSYNTSPLTGPPLLNALVAHDGTLLWVKMVALHLLYTLEGRQ
jgi:hypothetical protein